MGRKRSLVQIQSPRPASQLRRRAAAGSRRQSGTSVLIPHYKLETNPFAPEGARPFFSSESMRYAQIKLEQLLDGRLQSLFLSGSGGVGKSALVEHVVGARQDVQVSWIVPGLQDA